MRQQWRGPTLRMTAAACVTAALVAIAISRAAPEAGPDAKTGGISATAEAGAKPTPPGPHASPSPQPTSSPEPSATASPAPGTEAPAPQQEEPLPRILRSVCTDHLCGGCDGKCFKNGGHVAVDKKGHCACTPTAGSPLDRAIRGAYEKRPSQ